MKHILLVDDEDSIRNTFAIFLERAGYQAATAASVARALELLHSSTFDLIVTDIVLPDSDGLRLLHEAKRLELHTPVIMITGQPTIDNAAQSLREGAFDYLLKPVRKDDLLRAAQKALEYKDLLDGRQLLQEENARYRLRLEELVCERTRQLTRANAQLRQEIEERQQVEAALRQNQERLTLAMEISGAAAFESRPSEGVFICSERLSEITGLPREQLSRFHENYQHWLQRFHPDDREQFHRAFNDLNEGRQDFVDDVFRLQRADGEWIHLHGMARAVEHQPSGQASRIVGVIMDISAQMRSSELLRQQRDLGLLLNTASSQQEAGRIADKALQQLQNLEIFGLYAFDQQAQELVLVHQRGLPASSQQELTRIGTSSSLYKFLLTGAPLYTNYEVMPDLQHPALAGEGVKGVAEVPLMHENRLIGAMCLASRSSEHIPSDSRILIEALASQVTSALANLQAQEALRRSEAKYRNLVNTIPHGIMELGFDGAVHFCNQVTARRYGRTPEEMVGIAAESLIATSEGRREFAAMLEHLGKGDVTPSPFHFTVHDAQGDLVELQADWNWNHDDDGALKGITAVVTDITARNRAERALQQAHEELEHRVQTRTRELHETSQQLRRLAARQAEILEEERKRIAREIHDELGQNLTALNMGLSVLGNMLPQEEIQLQSRVNVLRTPLAQMIRAVQRICQELRPMQLDDLGLTAAIAWRIRDFQEATGVATRLYTDHEEISLDPELGTAVYRLVQEALTNAARHASPDRIDVTLTPREEHLEITVSDNGPGIDEKAVNSLESFGIMGMRERMRAVGGSLEILGRKGMGTTVRALFPWKPALDNEGLGEQ